MLKRAAREIGRRQTPVLGYRHIEENVVPGSQFAQSIIRRYQDVDEYNLPAAALVYLSQSILEGEEEKIRELVKNISVMNQFRISVTQHAYEEQHFLSLHMRCEQLFSFLSQSVVWQKSVNELRQIYQEIQKENRKKITPLKEKSTREIWEKAKERINRIEKEIGEKTSIVHKNWFFSRRWINEHEKRKRTNSFLWKSEQAKQFFWRVQRASKPEQALILAAAKESSLPGLINRLNILDEKNWLKFSQNLMEESKYLLENQEFMGSIARYWIEESVSKETKENKNKQFTEKQKQFFAHQDSVWKIRQWLEQHSREAQKDDVELEKKEFLKLLEEENGEEPWIWNQIKEDIFHRKIKQNTDWYLSASEAISYLSLEEWKTLKSEITKALSSRNSDEIPVVLRKKTLNRLNTGYPEKHANDVFNQIQMSEEKRELMDVLMQHKEELFFEQIMKNSSVLKEYIQWETEKDAASLSEEIESLSEREWQNWKKQVFFQIQQLETAIFPDEEDKIFLTKIRRMDSLKRRKEWLPFFLEGMQRTATWENQKVLLRAAAEAVSRLTLEEWKAVKEKFLENSSELLRLTARKTADEEVNSLISDESFSREKKEFAQSLSRRMKGKAKLTEKEDELLRQIIKTSHVLSRHDLEEDVSEHSILSRIIYGLLENSSQEKQLEERAVWYQSIADMIFTLGRKEWESFKTELWNFESWSEYREGKHSKDIDEISLPVLNWLIKEKENLMNEREYQESKEPADFQKKDTEIEKQKFLQRLFRHISAQSTETKNVIYSSLKSAITEITRLDKISVKTSLWYSSIAEVISCLDIRGWGKFKTEVLEEDREELQWLEKNKRFSEQEEEKENITEKEKQKFLYALLQQMTEESEYRKDKETKKKIAEPQITESESSENRYRLLNQLQKKRDELLLYAKENLERISSEKEEQVSQNINYPLPLVAEMVYLMKKEKRKHLSEELSDIFQESSTVTNKRFIEQIQHMIKIIPENPQESLENLEMDWMDKERKEVQKAEKIVQEEYAAVWQAIGKHVEQLFLPDVSSHFAHYPIKLSNARWSGQEAGKQIGAVQIIEQLRQDRIVNPLLIYSEKETGYELADITIAQNSSLRSHKNQTEALAARKEIQTEVKKQVQEYTDIQFITKGLDQSTAAQSQKELESLIRQVESQQKEINEIKAKTQAEEKLSRQDMLRLSKTVMKTMKNQLDMEGFRYGM